MIVDTVQRYLAIRPNSDSGYIQYSFWRGGKIIASRYAQVLVLETFAGPCPRGFQACHDDGNNQNNFLGNLRWDTPKNNAKDKIKHGTQLRGENMPWSKNTEEQVLTIRRLHTEGVLNQRQIANEVGIDYRQVNAIILRKVWTHI